MKKLIIAVSIVLWFSVAFGGDDFKVGDATMDYFEFEKIIPVKTNPLSIHNKQEVIQYFIDSGDVCKVIGHVWRTTNGGGFSLCQWDNGIVSCRPNPNTRKCTRCGKKQKQEVPDWEDID